MPKVYVENRIRSITVQSDHAETLRIAEQLRDGSGRHGQHDCIERRSAIACQAQAHACPPFGREFHAKHGGRTMHRIDPQRGSLREVREGYGGEAEARRARAAQKRRREDEERIGTARSVQRRVECGDEKRIPERAPRPRVLTVLCEPHVEGCAGIPALEERAGERSGYPQLAAQTQVAVPAERREQVQRRRQRRRTQTASDAVARKQQRVEAPLQVEAIRHADALREAHELGAAPEKDVLPVVDLAAVDLERSRSPTKQPTAFEHLHAIAMVLQF